MTPIALLLLLTGQGPAAAEGRGLAEDEAIRIFQRLCVAPLPSPERFAEAMNGSGLRWRKVRKSEAEVFGVGNSWRSALGEVTYHHPPYADIIRGGPACHFTFRTAEGYNHLRLAAAVATTLNLPPGIDTGSGKAPQMKWETDFPGGMHVRLFVSSNVPVPGGRGARLSISRRLDAPAGSERSGKRRRD